MYSRIFQRSKFGHFSMSNQNAKCRTTISTIPEELRQEITSYLSYDDAWSLKQTSTLFYRIVEIPTIKSFLARPYGPSLGMLEDEYIIPDGYETCHYCNRLLPKERFSRFQRRLTAARQHSLWFDYTSWKPEKHYCLDCGVKNQLYPAGKKVYIGFGDPEYREEAVVPCEHCRSLLEDGSWDFWFCPVCDEIVGTNQMMSQRLCGPSSSDSPSKIAICGDQSKSEREMEPDRNIYEDLPPESVLALIGERFLQ